MSANHSSPVPRKSAQTRVSAAAARRRVLRRLPTRLPEIMASGDTLLDTSTPQNLDMDIATTNNKPQTSVTIYCKIYFEI